MFNWKNTLDPLTRWPKQGDFVLVFTSNITSYWAIRDVLPMMKTDSVLPSLGYNLELLSEDKIYFRLPYIQYETQGLRWRMPISIQGYKLYRVTKVPDDLAALYNPV